MKIVTFVKKQWFIVAVLFLIVPLFLFLQPTLLANFSPSQNENLWNIFLKDIEKKKRIDTKVFWQMREFYSPGSFIFNREGFPQEKQAQLIQELSLPKKLHQNSLLFLQFNADKFSSFDSLVSTNSAPLFDDALASLAIKYPVIAKGENYIIVQKEKNKAVIIFLANEKEMKQANGFFDYRERDVNLVKGKLWLDISEIKIK